MVYWMYVLKYCEIVLVTHFPASSTVICFYSRYAHSRFIPIIRLPAEFSLTAAVMVEEHRYSNSEY